MTKDMKQLETKKIYLDLGCGNRKKENYLGIDRCLLKGVDIVADLDKDFPFKDSVIDGIYSNYFLEHVTNLVFIFQEMYRVCKNKALVIITVPYYTSINAFKDPTHKNFFTEETFRYFSRDKWYGSDYNFGIDFRVKKIKYHYSRLAKLLPFKKYIRRYLMNMVGAMTVELEVIKNKA